MIKKCQKIIESCTNKEQLQVAENYFNLVKDRIYTDILMNRYTIDSEFCEMVIDDLSFDLNEKKKQFNIE